ncbi:YnfA family protein [Ramlibacter sp. CrO1]|uniref:YnfA family protein n=1 Tax=Ramlibacter algicola TaxID=2795217 RepID=A0A934PZD9_9BURK|nr:YnfA family protein [Ramlibacter algicola]
MATQRADGVASDPASGAATACGDRHCRERNPRFGTGSQRGADGRECACPQAEGGQAADDGDGATGGTRRAGTKNELPGLHVNLFRWHGPIAHGPDTRTSSGLRVKQCVVPGALSLALFAWLLSLHPTAAGRVYAAYGGVYIGVAIVWLRVVDGVRPTWTDWVGVAVSLVGMAIIMFAPRQPS